MSRRPICEPCTSTVALHAALTATKAGCYHIRPSREGRCGRPAIAVSQPIRPTPLTAVRDRRRAHRSADFAERLAIGRGCLTNRRLEASISSRIIPTHRTAAEPCGATNAHRPAIVLAA